MTDDIDEPRLGGKTNLMELIAAAEQARRRNATDIPIIYVLVSFLYFTLGGIRSLITVTAVAVAGAWAGAHVFAGTALDVADGPVLGKLGISVAQLVGAAGLSLIWIALDVLLEGFIEPLLRSSRFRKLRWNRKFGVRLKRVTPPRPGLLRWIKRWRWEVTCRETVEGANESYERRGYAMTALGARIAADRTVRRRRAWKRKDRLAPVPPLDD